MANGIAISEEPLKETPAIVRGVVSRVAVAAFPVIDPAIGEEKVFVPPMVIFPVVFTTSLGRRAVFIVPVVILLALSPVIVAPLIYTGLIVLFPTENILRYLVPIFPSGLNIFARISPITPLGWLTHPGSVGSVA